MLSSTYWHLFNSFRGFFECLEQWFPALFINVGAKNRFLKHWELIDLSELLKDLWLHFYGGLSRRYSKKEICQEVLSLSVSLAFSVLFQPKQRQDCLQSQSYCSGHILWPSADITWLLVTELLTSEVSFRLRWNYSVLLLLVLMLLYVWYSHLHVSENITVPQKQLLNDFCIGKHLRYVGKTVCIMLSYSHKTAYITF